MYFKSEMICWPCSLTMTTGHHSIEIILNRMNPLERWTLDLISNLLLSSILLCSRITRLLWLILGLNPIITYNRIFQCSEAEILIISMLFWNNNLGLITDNHMFRLSPNLLSRKMSLNLLEIFIIKKA